MSLLADLKVLGHVFIKPIRGSNHQERLECFFKGQAASYDASRQRMLPGREALFRDLPVRPDGIWLDLGGGTGGVFEEVSERLGAMRKVYIVDLSASLLNVARQRIVANRWANVATAHCDIVHFIPPEGVADIITFSYSLTMTPDWFGAIDHAYNLLRPGGVIGVADYYVSRKYPANGMRRHCGLARTFWPAWFGMRNVHPSPDHLPYLMSRFERMFLHEEMAPVLCMLGARIPAYRFIGRKPCRDGG